MIGLVMCGTTKQDNDILWDENWAMQLQLSNVIISHNNINDLLFSAEQTN